MQYQEELKNLIPSKEFFAGIDSDGCVFDSMEVKQKEFFIPAALKFFRLFPIAKYVRETWEFVNLYSVHRGSNRFPALLKVFNLLSGRKEVMESGCRLPDLTALKKWVEKESQLSNSSLREFLEVHKDPYLETVLQWSEEINREIGKWLQHVPVFPTAKNTIGELAKVADLLIISQTPVEALEREWEEHDMRKLVLKIAGQEYGTKYEQIFYAAKNKYQQNKIIMIGDSIGDLNAAVQNKILFFPVIPGFEEKSWKRFRDEGVKRFMKGTFEGKYQSSLLKEFIESLPSLPSWSV
jgi:phosphoglycolate phosphatase-like HAD superfamily hydrolase